MARLFKTEVARRFQRAIRLDVDFRAKDALSDYVPLPTSLAALARMGEQVSKSSQRAFTWTGPYGGGKSSLALLLASLLDGDARVRQSAQAVVGLAWASKIQKAFNLGKAGWLVVPVVGQRANIVRVLDEALTIALKQRFRGHLPKGVAEAAGSDPRRFLARLGTAAGLCCDRGSGILIIVDEMGRFLEHSVTTDGDISFLQELAEIVGRSRETVVIVGVLHQAFEQYASKLGGDSRAEWAKIQGRFVDVPLTTGPEETIRLIAQALVGDRAPTVHAELCEVVAEIVRERRIGISDDFAELLQNCWPLHPLVALLLASVSRRRFGQNERSTFGFLNSGEPGGFQEFLANAPDRDALYGPEEFWNYLRLNLEPAILASSDGHRWSQAVEAVDRTENKGEKAHVVLAKTIATLDLFGSQVGLVADDKLLRGTIGNTKSDGAQLLDDLRSWSTVIFRAHSRSWGVFAGSDFDIDAELAVAKTKTDFDFSVLQQILTQQVVIAKKHYYESGTLRWLEVRICAVEDFALLIEKYRPTQNGACGFIALGIPKGRASLEINRLEAELNSEKTVDFPFLLGIPRNASDIRALTQELMAIEYIRVNVSALEGDEIARRELAARSVSVREQLDQKMMEMLGNAFWYHNGEVLELKNLGDLSRAASICASRFFHGAPIIKNELINRSKPSSNAVSAANELMRLMVVKGDQPALGIEGFPPQRAIYESVLVAPGFHRRDRQSSNGFKFDGPTMGPIGKTFGEMWSEGDKFLSTAENARRSLSDLYAAWERPPFGIRRGVIPIYALVLILAKESELALYLDGQFVPELDTFFVDRLLQDPSSIQVRRFKVAGITRSVLERLSALVSDRAQGALSLDVLSVAKPLVGFIRSLHPWVKRTRTLASATTACRDCILKATDPVALLFDDLPSVFGLNAVAYNHGDTEGLNTYMAALRQALDELRAAYPRLLDRISLHIRRQVGVELASEESRFQISERAATIVGLSGDFRLDAFATRLKSASDSVEWLENISGFAANKPVRDWIDNDIEKATFELSELSARFNRAETVASTLNRGSGTETVAIVVGHGQGTRALMDSVYISPSDKELAKEVLTELRARLMSRGLEQTKLLAIIAEIAKVILGQARAEDPISLASGDSERPKTWN